MQKRNTATQHLPAPDQVQRHQRSFSTTVVSSPPPGQCGSRTSAEAANLERLGNYSLVYAMLAALADAALLVVITVFGVSLDGAFGGIAIARMLLRVMAASALVLFVYTCTCASDFAGNRWRRPALQFLCVTAFFIFLGLDHGDMTDRTAQLLRWVSNHAGCISAFPESGAMPG